MQLRHRLLSTPERIEVAAAGEQQSVDRIKGVYYHVGVIDGRYDYGHTASPHHSHIVWLGECSVSVCKVSGDSYHRFFSSFRISLVYPIKARLEIKWFHVLKVFFLVDK